MMIRVGMRPALYSRIASRAARRRASSAAVVVGQIGKLDARQLELKDFALPERPPSGHVRVKVAAAGINFAEILQMQGLYQEAAEAPYVPGNECAGEVEALGDGAGAPSDAHPAGLRVGDAVLGVPRGGAWARGCDVPAAACFALPRDDARARAVDLADGAALPIACGAAHLALARRSGRG